MRSKKRALAITVPTITVDQNALINTDPAFLKSCIPLYCPVKTIVPTESASAIFTIKCSNVLVTPMLHKLEST